MEELLKELENKYPFEKATFESLRFENIEKRKHALKRCGLLALSVPALYAWYAFGNEMPLLREYGRWFGTHRRFRHYSYLLMLSSIPWWKYLSSQKRTVQQLQRVDSTLQSRDQTYIQPQKPIFYPYTLQ